MQRVLAILDGDIRELCLPHARAEVMPGVPWGNFDQLFTPAYWASQIWMLNDDPQTLSYKLGRTLKEEVCACMLGGHGITAEMSLAAYDAIRRRGLLEQNVVTEAEIGAVLREKLSDGTRSFHYRFPNKKASYLAPVLNALTGEVPQSCDHQRFRSWFLRFAGIGFKTASWITRNWLNSGNVAILDIHVVRCGRICRLFNEVQNPARNYCQMEDLLLEFARRLKVHAGKLDVLMWQQMRMALSFGVGPAAPQYN